ncbi:hypothetical protein QUF79_00390 [Fictibacillus enclensis]|uniref:hypothetical protein n=1 Tax=Fictibacillus enclensis TaxID=1017270 RepID=UPI0025A09F50|nr:hypothetical protein [Fictibacillus enclensis]MDM5196557.1 hypothetical protein [Fictibacillus enclensis]
MDKPLLENAEVKFQSPRQRKIKARWLVMTFIFLSTVLAYTDRSNISIVAVTMMKEFGWNEQQLAFWLQLFSLAICFWEFLQDGCPINGEESSFLRLG